MIILQVNNVTKRFDGVDIFQNVNMTINQHSRTALVGRNGAGKTTLVKMITGQLEIDEGTINTPKGIRIGYLAQNTGLHSQRSIWDEMETVFAALKKKETQMHELETQMSDPTINNDPTKLQQITSTYDQVQADFTDHNGYGYQNEIRGVLAGFGFTPDTYEQSIDTLSGGQQTQLALAKLLLEKRDLLILDEPTNHLDVATIGWLENYIQGYAGALLIISHDRYFMDKVVDNVYDLSNGTLHHYPGNYSHFVQEKAKQAVLDMQQYEKQQIKIKKEEDFIKKNIVRASTTKRAQARRKQLEKMERIEKPRNNEKVARVNFSVDKPSGNIVLTVKDLAIGYDQEVLSAPININLDKQQRMAVVGPNGVGKSTLLKTILKKIPPIKGTISLGTGVEIGYYDQKQATLHNNKTVLNELWDEYPTTNEGVIRTVLGSFLFSGEEVNKSVATLSGGEKARLMLAKLSMRHDNFLMLDEPTNHLDIESRENLETALKNYAGTILFISHDRYFINQIASDVLEIDHDGSHLYLGNYDYYFAKKEEEAAIQEHQQANQPTKHKVATPTTDGQKGYVINKQTQKQKRQLERQMTQLEAQMNELDEQKTSIEKEMTTPDTLSDIPKLNQLQTALETVSQKAEQLSDQWTDLGMKLEDLD